MEEEYKEQLEYIKNQVRLCLKQSRDEYNKAKKDNHYSNMALELRSITEYNTVLSIIKNSENKKRREYDKQSKL